MRLIRLASALLLASGLAAVAAPGVALADAGQTTTVTANVEVPYTFTGQPSPFPCQPGNSTSSGEPAAPLYDVTGTARVHLHETVRLTDATVGAEANFQLGDDSQWVPENDPSLPTYTQHVSFQGSLEAKVDVATGTGAEDLTGHVREQIHGSDGSMFAINEPLREFVVVRDATDPNGQFKVFFIKAEVTIHEADGSRVVVHIEAQVTLDAQGNEILKHSSGDIERFTSLCS